MEDEGASGVCDTPKGFGSVALLALRTLLKELLEIDLPSLKECALAFQAAFESSWHALSAWAAVMTLLLSPVLHFLAVLARAVWPHVQGAAAALLRYQASLPLSTVLAEVAVVVFVVAVYLLRRFIVRQRYLPRAQRRVRLFRATLSRRYASFTAAVERNLRLSARAFPHVVYWTAAGSFAWLTPYPAGWLRENFSVFVTASWPTLYGLYLTLLLRSQNQDAPNGISSTGAGGAGTPGGANGGVDVGGGTTGARRRTRISTPVRTPVASTSTSTSTPGTGTGTSSMARSPGAALGRGARVMPQDVDRVLMYWVVFTVVKVISLLPFASTAAEIVGKPFVRSIAFFLVLWMHLPGPGSGLQLVYSKLEPLVHKYVKDLRASQNGYSGMIEKWQDLAVLLRLMTKEHAELLTDNIADSWMLVPALLCFFTPAFITNFGCVYAGLVVPSLNSIKTLGLGRSQSRSTAADMSMSDGWAALATSPSSARVRWITYWVAYGGWWQVSWQLGALLRIIPFATHAQLALLLWLQVPVFRGGGRILDFGERCMERWAQGTGADASAAVAESATPWYSASSPSQPQ
eukprot:g18280.t1